MTKTLSRLVLGLALFTAPALMLGCGEEGSKPADSAAPPPASVPAAPPAGTGGPAAAPAAPAAPAK